MEHIPNEEAGYQFAESLVADLKGWSVRSYSKEDNDSKTFASPPPMTLHYHFIPDLKAYQDNNTFSEFDIVGPTVDMPGGLYMFKTMGCSTVFHVKTSKRIKKLLHIDGDGTCLICYDSIDPSNASRYSHNYQCDQCESLVCTDCRILELGNYAISLLNKGMMEDAVEVNVKCGYCRAGLPDACWEYVEQMLEQNRDIVARRRHHLLNQ